MPVKTTDYYVETYYAQDQRNIEEGLLRYTSRLDLYIFDLLDFNQDIFLTDHHLSCWQRYMDNLNL